MTVGQHVCLYVTQSLITDEIRRYFALNSGHSGETHVFGRCSAVNESFFSHDGPLNSALVSLLLYALIAIISSVYVYLSTKYGSICA